MLLIKCSFAVCKNTTQFHSPAQWRQRETNISNVYVCEVQSHMYHHPEIYIRSYGEKFVQGLWKTCILGPIVQGLDSQPSLSSWIALSQSRTMNHATNMLACVHLGSPVHARYKQDRDKLIKAWLHSIISVQKWFCCLNLTTYRTWVCLTTFPMQK